MSVVVTKNSKIPSKHYKTVTTVADNQTVISFSVYQGERTSTMHNKHLGSFSLSGISPAPRRVPRIDVCFDIDSSSILTVTAKDKITGNKNNLQLEAAKLKLTMEEIELMVQEAEKYKLDDIELGNIADMRINLETLVFNAEESAIFLDSQGNLNKEDKCILLNKCESVSHWLNKNKNASKETLFQQQIEFQNCCHPIFIRICRDKQHVSAHGVNGQKSDIDIDQSQSKSKIAARRAALDAKSEGANGKSTSVNPQFQKKIEKETLTKANPAKIGNTKKNAARVQTSELNQNKISEKLREKVTLYKQEQSIATNIQQHHRKKNKSRSFLHGNFTSRRDNFRQRNKDGYSQA
ncbi:heat shock cognate 71 kDa protein-like [Styela clava]